MVDYVRVQDRIYYGYGKAALKLGKTYSIYRATNATNPISISNLEGTTLVSPTVDWKYMRANKYGNPVWILLVDGRVIEPYDYLVGVDFTFFVNEMEPLLPINGVECNKVVSIKRPHLALTPGGNPYGGYETSGVLQTATGLPISVKQGGRMENNKFNLPLDTKSPSYEVLLPFLPGFNIRIGDFIDDDDGVRIAVTSVEETSIGFRCLAVSQQV